MSELRKKFEEKLSERVKIILINCDFNDSENRYYWCDLEEKDDFNLGVINGAWYMFFEDHEKQQAIIDDLRSQLNNMEQCYIEKKKECEGLQARANKALSVTGNYCDEDDAALLVFVLEKALRGAND